MQSFNDTVVTICFKIFPNLKNYMRKRLWLNFGIQRCLDVVLKDTECYLVVNWFVDTAHTQTSLEMFVINLLFQKRYTIHSLYKIIRMFN